jgi:carbon storage regulator
MLVLSRKSQEAVVVGAPNGYDRVVKVTVLEIRAGQVKLGFEADDDVPVHRWEIWQRLFAGARPNPREGPSPLMDL